MDQFTPDQIYNAILVFLALCGAVAAVGKAVEVVKGWSKPQSTLRADVAADKRRLDEHDQELEALSAGLRVTCAGVQVLIEHGLHNGNEDDMVAASKAINSWLLNK